MFNILLRLFLTFIIVFVQFSRSKCIALITLSLKATISLYHNYFSLSNVYLK